MPKLYVNDEITLFDGINFKTVLRIREVYPGSEFFPSGIRIFFISDPESP